MVVVFKHHFPKKEKAAMQLAAFSFLTVCKSKRLSYMNIR